MCIAGHIVIGGLYVCLMEMGSLKSQGSVRKCSHLCERRKRLPALLQNREKSPNWICLTAGSVGRGRLLLVSPYSAVPGFIRPFTNTRRQTWAKMSCVEQMGFSGTFFLALLPQACPIKHRSTFLKQGLLIPVQPRCALGNFTSV